MSQPASCFVFTPQAAMSYEMIRQRVLAAEKLGFDGYWVVDHMWGSGAADLDFLEGWTTIAGLAEATSTIRLGVLVTCNPFRHPGLLAKSVTTIDHMSGGRVELGMGAGWMEEEFEAYGWPFPSVGRRLKQLEESLEIIRRLCSEDRTSFDGQYYRLANAPFMPKPVQARLPMTLGGSGLKVFMKLVAQFADRWNCPMPSVPDMNNQLEALDRHCDAIGRDPKEIIVSEQCALILGRDEADVKKQVELAKVMIGGFVDIPQMTMIGTPAQIAEQMRQRMAAGVKDFAILFSDFGTLETMELFATEVKPHLAGA